MLLHPSMHLSECLWMFSLLLFLLFLSSLLKVNPSSGLCDVHHLLSTLPPVWLLPLFHASIASLATPLLCLLCPSPPHPSIHPSLHAPNLPHNPPTGDNVMCRGAYRRPSLSRQPLVLGVKGKPHQCQLFDILHHFPFTFSLSDSFFLLVCHLFDQSWVSSCESHASAITSYSTMTFLCPLAPSRGGEWSRQCWRAVRGQWLRLLHQSGH